MGANVQNRGMKLRHVVSFAFMLLAPAAARAEGPEAPAPAQNVEWYGWQTLASDGVSLGLVATSVGLWLADPSVQPSRGVHVIEPLAVAGATLFALGAPAIHWAHGRVGTGFGSFGIRVGAGGLFALGLGMIAFGQPCSGFGCTNTNGDAAEIGLGTFLAIAGAVTPPVLDALYFAHEPARPKRAAYVAPSLVPVKGGATLGLAGAF